MEITIRLADATDIDTIFDIRTSVKENHLSRDQLAERGITHDAIREALLAAPCIWMADVNGTAAGFAMADGAEGSIFAAFVRPESEGRGLGRLLMDKAETFLFQQHQRIWLETDGASRASGFYRKLGWLPVACLPGGDVRFEKQKKCAIYLGGCLCGAIRFEATGPALNPHNCSCKFCQKHTGALTASWVEFPRENVKWTGPGRSPATYRSSEYSSRAFCGNCGSSVGAIDDAPTVALLVAAFDDNHAKELQPEYHSFKDGAPAWASVA
ncbi:GNAT family N-acetyltransferase [Janthinobacterium fluminis]|uniref:GNAT family N-acetyltransferase n=1 Tax=Janthinobacterium fluminis TaxID=2987524 RepID=A0ABT5JWI9_9BURK|nr:GNAT family N-acetyltransferase [Janthinobacterium fluminis]MDC8756431.1 GNAT family N-acetyltransferase [Janthinobacterium fluminis]